MTDQQTKNTRVPAPLYAAAGAGDLAYRQLRKLPAVVSELSDRAVASLREANVSATSLRDRANATATTLRDRATTTATSLRDRATTTDLEQLRTTAASSATAFAQAAQERAAAVYTALVAHGERVVGSGVVQTADAVNADIEATEEHKAVGATPTDGQGAPGQGADAKTRAKRTRPTAK
jgi:heparin binding hemagglutinin HbhA